MLRRSTDSIKSTHVILSSRLHTKRTVARICRERFPWLSESYNLIDALPVCYCVDPCEGILLANYDDFRGLESPTFIKEK